MNGTVIPGTPIAVDFWKIRECPSARLFFLTHLHGDHVVGLSSSWQHTIYCSEFTGDLLRKRYGISASLIHPLEVGSSTILYVDSDQQEQMAVTVINAHHCPGSVMFLFEGYFGKILYTGDFRFDEEMRSDPILDNLSNVDSLYLDNTYNFPGSVFPSRKESIQQILQIIRDHEDYDIKIGLRNLGKEDLLMTIAKEFNEWILVNSSTMEAIELLGLPNLFTTSDWECRIEVVPFYSVSNKNVTRWNETRPTIAILPTALYTGLDMSPFCNQDNVFIVPYSDHSSYNELKDFVKMVKPARIYPIVAGEARGPFGVSFSNRSDMSGFSSYLSNQTREKLVIPESTKRWMFGCKLVPKSTSMNQNKKPLRLKKNRSLTKKKKGITFEDSDSDQSSDENIENRNPCKRRKVHSGRCTTPCENGEKGDSHALLNNDQKSCEELEDYSENDKSQKSQENIEITDKCNSQQTHKQCTENDQLVQSSTEEKDFTGSDIIHKGDKVKKNECVTKKQTSQQPPKKIEILLERKGCEDFILKEDEQKKLCTEQRISQTGSDASSIRQASSIHSTDNDHEKCPSTVKHKKLFLSYVIDIEDLETENGSSQNSNQKESLEFIIVPNSDENVQNATKLDLRSSQKLKQVDSHSQELNKSCLQNLENEEILSPSKNISFEEDSGGNHTVKLMNLDEVINPQSLENSRHDRDKIPWINSNENSDLSTDFAGCIQVISSCDDRDSKGENSGNKNVKTVNHEQNKKLTKSRWRHVSVIPVSNPQKMWNKTQSNHSNIRQRSVSVIPIHARQKIRNNAVSVKGIQRDIKKHHTCISAKHKK